MGKKYIIELEDKPFHKDGDFLCRVKGFNSLVFDMTGIGMLTPYTEPDLKKVRKEAYKEGREAGIKDGMCEVWEAVKKLARMDTDTSESITGYFGLHNIMHNLTASEVIEKIKAWEDGKQKINVGDEVEAVYGKAVVIEILGNNKSVIYMYHNASTGVSGIDKVTKTGRHFTEIDSVLEKMRGEQDG